MAPIWNVHAVGRGLIYAMAPALWKCRSVRQWLELPRQYQVAPSPRLVLKPWHFPKNLSQISKQKHLDFLFIITNLIYLFSLTQKVEQDTKREIEIYSPKVCNSQDRAKLNKPRIAELHLGLLYRWQGAEHLGHHLLPSNMHY